MARPKTTEQRHDDGNAALHDVIEGLSGNLQTLSQQVEVLRVAIDDLRQEVEFAVRNLPREPWAPVQPIVSMPKDPLANPFPVNRTQRQDVAAEEQRPAAPSPVAEKSGSSPPQAAPRSLKRKTDELF